MENNDAETSEDKHTLLPSPKFTRRPVYKGCIICQVCFGSLSIKSLNRSNLQEISNFEKFIDYAQRWKQYDPEYNKVYDAIDLTSSNDKYPHKACKGKFLKESYLTSQQTLQTSCEIPQQNELGTEIQNQTVVNPRRSNRKSITYSSSNVERKCIICNENKCHKGTLLPLYNITLKQVDSQIYNVEEKLIEFAHLHINNNNLKYTEAANRILLTNTSKLFYAAVVLYYKCCNFRSPWWASNKSINNESEQNNSIDYTLLYELV